MRVDLDIQPSLEGLAYAGDRLEALLERHGVAAPRIGQARLIVEEWACNAIEHGGCGAARIPLHLSLSVDTRALALELRDRGQAFDPMTASPPDLDAATEDRAIGGLGLHLMRQVADTLDYRREGGTNIVHATLLQPFPPDREDPP